MARKKSRYDRRLTKFEYEALLSMLTEFRDKPYMTYNNAPYLQHYKYIIKKLEKKIGKRNV